MFGLCNSMADFLTKIQRSERMSRIRSRGNKETELALAKLLRQHRIKGWRRNRPIFGKPDFVFQKSRLAIFVDGCFWHGCPKHSRHVAKSGEYWTTKLLKNRRRDILVTQTLRSNGWCVIRIWECDLQKRPQSCIQRIQKCLNRKI